MHSAISRLYFHTLSDFPYPAFFHSPHSKVVVLYIGPSLTLSWISSPFRSSRYLKERNKRYGTEASNSRLFSRSTERTIRLLCPRPPFFTWLHFCPLLDILFYWTKPSFLPSCLPDVPTCSLSLCRRLYTRGYVLPFLWESIYPIFFNLPSLLSATGTTRQKTPAPLFWRRAFRPRHRFIPRLEFQTLLFILPRNFFANLRSSSSSISG